MVSNAPLQFFPTLFIVVVLGCGPSGPTHNDAADTSPLQAQAATGSTDRQSIDGDGFTLQAPVSWTKLPLPSGVGISSPFDFSKGIAGVSVSVATLPVQSPQTPAAALASLLSNNRNIGDVESETQIKVSGRDATKLVHTLTSRKNTTSDEVSVSRMVRVFVPLDAGVLAFQAQGADADVKSVMPQLDAIIESIKLK